MGYDIKLNKDVAPVSGIQIGDNACQMLDVNIDPITYVARIDYSFVSLKFHQLPQKVLSTKFMNHTVAIYHDYNKKYGAARYGNKAANQLFGDKLYEMNLGAEAIPTTTISFTTQLDPDIRLCEQDLKIDKVFATPTIGTLKDSIAFKEANKQYFIIQKDKDKPADFDNSTNSKLRLLYRFYNAQTLDTINRSKMFEQITKLAGKESHEIMRDVIIKKDVQMLMQLDRKQFKELRKQQPKLIPSENTYEKKTNFCGTDKAKEILIHNAGVTTEFFKVPLMNRDNSLAVYNTAAFRLFLQTGQKDILTIPQCERLSAIHEFQVQASLRPDYMKPPGRYLRNAG